MYGRVQDHSVRDKPVVLAHGGLRVREERRPRARQSGHTRPGRPACEDEQRRLLHIHDTIFHSYSATMPAYRAEDLRRHTAVLVAFED